MAESQDNQHWEQFTVKVRTEEGFRSYLTAQGLTMSQFVRQARQQLAELAQTITQLRSELARQRSDSDERVALARDVEGMQQQQQHALQGWNRAVRETDRLQAQQRSLIDQWRSEARDEAMAALAKVMMAQAPEVLETVGRTLLQSGLFDSWLAQKIDALDRGREVRR
jgi:hypothetical protein